MSDLEKRLREAGLELPELYPRNTLHAPFTRIGPMLFISGQTPVRQGKIAYRGIVGVDLVLEEAIKAAQLCALNVLAQAGLACGGDFQRIRSCARITGYVRCREDFTEQPKVLDGASEVFVTALAEAGRHARTAVGASSLPHGVPVEVEAIFEVAT